MGNILEKDVQNKRVERVIKLIEEIQTKLEKLDSEEIKNSVYIAIKKFNMWFHFFAEVINKIDPLNVNIHALVFTYKTVLFCGILESLIPENQSIGSKAKFIKVMEKLNKEEKLLFTQLITDGKSDIDEEAILAYLKCDFNKLDEIFKNKVEKFYMIRCELVHKGIWLFGAKWPLSDSPLYFGIVIEEENKKEDEKLIIMIRNENFTFLGLSLDEIILRAIAKYFDITFDKDDIKEKVEKFLGSEKSGYIAYKYSELFKQKFKK